MANYSCYAPPPAASTCGGYQMPQQQQHQQQMPNTGMPAYTGYIVSNIPTASPAPSYQNFSGSYCHQPQYSYAPQPNYSFSQPQQCPPTPQSTTTTTQGLANYGAGPYKVMTPMIVAGPSYSTTSYNDEYGCGNGSSGGGYYTGGVSMPLSYTPDFFGGYQDMGGYCTQQQGAKIVNMPPIPLPSYSSQCVPPSSPPQHQPTQSSCQPSSSRQHSPLQVDQLAPQIDQCFQEAVVSRRQPIIKRQVITVPGTPGKIQQVVRRVPTPTPDVIERVFVVKPQRDVVNLVIERPGTPPATYRDRTIIGKPRRPVIHSRVVRVQPRIGQIGYHQSSQSPPPALPRSQPPPASYSCQSRGFIVAPPQYNTNDCMQTSSSFDVCHQQQQLQQPTFLPAVSACQSMQFQPSMSTSGCGGAFSSGVSQAPAFPAYIGYVTASSNNIPSYGAGYSTGCFGAAPPICNPYGGQQYF